jgi:hypothetical protein
MPEWLRVAEPRAPFVAKLSRIAVDHNPRHPASFQFMVSAPLIHGDFNSPFDFSYQKAVPGSH